MPIVNHIVILVSYALVAAAVGTTLPHHVEGIDASQAAEIGAALLFCCLFAHFAITRFARDKALAHEIALLKLGHEETRAELARTRDEARRVLDSIDNAIRARQGHITDIETVMTEVKVLQDLVEQLSEGRAMPAAKRERNQEQEKAAAAGGARPPRPVPPTTPCWRSCARASATTASTCSCSRSSACRSASAATTNASRAFGRPTAT
jgi:TolA-binding protein